MGRTPGVRRVAATGGSRRPAILYSMPATVDIGTLITKRPEMHGGKPCVAGTGLTVLPIVDLYQQGLSPAEIQEQYPHISLASVLAALTYWAANPDEIAEWFRLDEEAYREWEAEEAARGKPGN